jgi:SAM-dependent methyltransferase
VEGAHGVDQPGDRGADLSDAAAWSGATYERIAEAFLPVHERIVAALAPAPGDNFLDLACGTGGVALVAARAGSNVTGIDIAADQVEKARTAAEQSGLAIRFDQGDVQALPYGDGEFDSVASAFGLIFAPDHALASRELMRVSRPAAKFAISAWTRDDWFRLGQRLRPDYVGTKTDLWSDEEYVRGLFPEAELSFERGEATISAESADDCWQLLSASVAPLKTWLDTLDEAGRQLARVEYGALIGDGSLRREYVLILGTRR